MDVRRVVTGHDADGKAVFASDERVPPVTPALLPGSEFHRLWGGDEAPRFPDDGSMPAHTSYFPPVGGFRFGFFTIPPDGGRGAPADLDVEAALAELESALPGLAGHMEPDAPGMHTTATIDFEVVLEGEVTLELDDGERVTLRPGDTVVQNGTRHRWSNPGDVPARLAVFIVGAHHDRITG
ncbi:MAG TPA: cupin domain-containing protein [Acidimicrobiales bacterium]|nr:cupin domain-containing protein [Acidimicrobiales bacterium]